MTWKPHKYQDLDKGRKFPKEKICLKHGVHYGAFCFMCYMERQGVVEEIEHVSSMQRQERDTVQV